MSVLNTDYRSASYIRYEVGDRGRGRGGRGKFLRPATVTWSSGLEFCPASDCPFSIAASFRALDDRARIGGSGIWFS